MQIFNTSAPWEEKVNFADENNVMLGYDMSQDCCERAFWFNADAPAAVPPDKDVFQPEDMPGWAFDPAYFVEVAGNDNYPSWWMAIFRITNGSQDKFLHLCNCHNGYYSHGFTFKGAPGFERKGTL